MYSLGLVASRKGTVAVAGREPVTLGDDNMQGALPIRVVCCLAVSLAPVGAENSAVGVGHALILSMSRRALGIRVLSRPGVSGTVRAAWSCRNRASAPRAGPGSFDMR